MGGLPEKTLSVLSSAKMFRSLYDKQRRPRSTLFASILK